LGGTKIFGGRRRRTKRTKTKDFGRGEVEHAEVGTVEELWLVRPLLPEVGGLELEK
jgi:hypothetical protein